MPIKNQLPGYPLSGVKAMSGKKARRKSVLTMANYACNRHHRWLSEGAKNISINHTLVGYAYIQSFTPVVLELETIPVRVGWGGV